MEENMVRHFATIQSNLPKTEPKMINFLRNNHNITNINSLGNEITMQEKNIAIENFAKHLIFEDGVEKVKLNEKNNNPILISAFEEIKHKILTLTTQQQRETMPKHDKHKIARWIENNARLHPIRMNDITTLGHTKKEFFLLFANWWLENKFKSTTIPSNNSNINNSNNNGNYHPTSGISNTNGNDATIDFSTLQAFEVSSVFFFLFFFCIVVACFVLCCCVCICLFVI